MLKCEAIEASVVSQGRPSTMTLFEAEAGVLFSSLLKTKVEAGAVSPPPTASVVVAASVDASSSLEAPSGVPGPLPAATPAPSAAPALTRSSELPRLSELAAGTGGGESSDSFSVSAAPRPQSTNDDALAFFPPSPPASVTRPKLRAMAAIMTSSS